MFATGNDYTDMLQTTINLPLFPITITFLVNFNGTFFSIILVHNLFVTQSTVQKSEKKTLGTVIKFI